MSEARGKISEKEKSERKLEIQQHETAEQRPCALPYIAVPRSWVSTANDGLLGGKALGPLAIDKLYSAAPARPQPIYADLYSSDPEKQAAARESLGFPPRPTAAPEHPLNTIQQHQAALQAAGMDPVDPLGAATDVKQQFVPYLSVSQNDPLAQMAGSTQRVAYLHSQIAARDARIVELEKGARHSQSGQMLQQRVDEQERRLEAAHNRIMELEGRERARAMLTHSLPKPGYDSRTDTQTLTREDYEKLQARAKAPTAMSDTSAPRDEKAVEKGVRDTITDLIGGRVGRGLREELGDALGRARRDAGVGGAIGQRRPGPGLIVGRVL